MCGPARQRCGQQHEYVNPMTKSIKLNLKFLGQFSMRYSRHGYPRATSVKLDPQILVLKGHLDKTRANIVMQAGSSKTGFPDKSSQLSSRKKKWGKKGCSEPRPPMCASLRSRNPASHKNNFVQKMQGPASTITIQMFLFFFIDVDVTVAKGTTRETKLEPKILNSDEKETHCAKTMNTAVNHKGAEFICCLVVHVQKGCFATFFS